MWHVRRKAGYFLVERPDGVIAAVVSFTVAGLGLSCREARRLARHLAQRGSFADRVAAQRFAAAGLLN